MTSERDVASVVRRFVLRLVNLMRPERAEPELAREVASHLTLLEDEFRQRGMSDEEARHAARRAFGNVDQAKEHHRAARSFSWLDDAWRDVRYALRSLRRDRLTTAVAVLCLSLGIGANTLVFSLVNGLLLRPLPFEDPDRLVLLHQVRHERPDETGPVSYRTFREWREQGASRAELAALRTGALTVGDGRGEASRHPGAYVTWNLFAMLGVQPARGRLLAAHDDRPGAEPVVVISDGLWQQRFGRNDDLVGRSVLIDGEAHTVVGIMPRGFAFPRNQQFWLPLARTESSSADGSRPLAVYARLAPGVSVGHASAGFSAIAQRLATLQPDVYRGWDVGVRRMSAFVPARQRVMLLVAMGAVALVLLMACANVANLTLARAVARRREIAIRTAIGAPRRRIVAQLLTESVLIALLSVPVGIAFAAWGLAYLWRTIPEQARLFGASFEIDAVVLRFTIGLAVLTAVVFGLAPAVQTLRHARPAALGGGRELNTGMSQKRLRHALVVGEVALSVILLVSAALFVRSFLNLLRADNGFDPAPLLTFQLDLPSRADPDAAGHLVEEIVQRVAALPGVQAAAASDLKPLRGGGTRDTIDLDGNASADGETGPRVLYGGVTSRFFDTLDVPASHGRMMTERESTSESAVAVINSTLADRFWPDSDPIGRRFRLRRDASETWFTVIGVTPDIANWDVSDRPVPTAFLPYAYTVHRDRAIVVRSTGDAGRLAAAIRETVRAIDPAIPLPSLESMTEIHRLVFWRNRLLTGVFLCFAAVAALLAAIGIHGLLSHAVAERRREVGLRMAIGASARDVVSLVVREGMALVLTGLALGLVGALAMTRLLRGQLYELGATDPASFAGAALLVVVVGLLGSYMPARRAAAVDPLTTLRE